MEMLRVDNLRKEFDGIKAVDGLSFSLAKGTIASLIGPNGAGKTTAFNILVGICRPDAGSVHINGKNVTRLSPYKIAKMGIGRTFQSIRVFPQMSVLDNLMLAPHDQEGERFFSALLRPRRVRTDEEKAREKAFESLRLVGLLGKQGELAENLSHGQRKLLELVRALATNPDLLLLDEPTAGVFPETRKKIIDLLRELRGQGKAILLIEHDMKTVMTVSDKVIVMAEGRKIAEGRPEEIRHNKDVIEAYLGRENATA